MKYLFAFCLQLCVLITMAQPIPAQLQRLETQLSQLKEEQKVVEHKIETLHLLQWHDLLVEYLPALEEGEERIDHSLMSLVYAEEYEMARWVGHVISPEIIEGAVTRTNDFRPDPMIATGSTVEADYFLKFLQPDSSYKYDGFGYDRGHLAPSADFRWSKKALSESYYYSNMAPQLPEFNREIWAELENEVRAYVYRHPEHPLIVFTGPVLEADLPVLERSVNQVRIPKAFWKVVLDPVAKQGIGYVLPHAGTDYPVASFARPINEVETISGLDFFSAMPDAVEEEIESRMDKAYWLESVANGAVEPLYAPDLPANHFNTVQAKAYMNQQDEITVCGTVVGARYSRSGNALLNLDQPFPNQIFTVFIRKEHLINFSYDPVEALKDKVLYVKGKVVSLSGTAAVFLETEKHLEVKE